MEWGCWGSSHAILRLARDVAATLVPTDEQIVIDRRNVVTASGNTRMTDGFQMLGNQDALPFGEHTFIVMESGTLSWSSARAGQSGASGCA